MAPIPGNGATVQFFRRVGIVAGAMVALSAVAVPPIAAMWWFATQPIIERLDRVNAARALSDSLLVREVARLTTVSASNRELILLVAEMNKYGPGSTRRLELWEKILAEDRRTQRKLEP